MSGAYDEGLKKMTKLVNSLLGRTDSGPFREPVDWKNLGLFDYPKIIKRMMDLGTVKRKLERKEYAMAKECADDIRLIWDNCKTYNADGSDFYLLAESFSKRFEDRYKKIQTEYDTGDNNDQKSHKDKTIQSLDAKMKFTSSLYRLSGVELGHILQVLDLRCPQALELVDTCLPEKEGKEGTDHSSPTTAAAAATATATTVATTTGDDNNDDDDDDESKRSSKKKRSPDYPTPDGILQTDLEINVDAIDSRTFMELDRFVSEKIMAKTTANINDNMINFKKKARRAST